MPLRSKGYWKWRRIYWGKRSERNWEYVTEKKRQTQTVKETENTLLWRKDNKKKWGKLRKTLVKRKNKEKSEGNWEYVTEDIRQTKEVKASERYVTEEKEQ